MATEPALEVSSEVNVERWSQGELTHVADQVAEEMPIALVYHGVPHVVMLASPADLEDFAYGFVAARRPRGAFISAIAFASASEA